MKNRIKSAIHEFMNLIKKGDVEIYNEFSFQHEVGIFLRNKFSPEFKVQFERNTKYFKIETSTKHEIDIVIYNDNQKYAIELKYPLNKQYPEQMYSFIKDISFMEEVKEGGFHTTFCLVLVSDNNFYEEGNMRKTDGIYSYFRVSANINGEIFKPTGEKVESVSLKGNYKIDWKDCKNKNDEKYFLLDIME